MARPQLRVYLGSEDSCELAKSSPLQPERADVTVALGDVLPLLVDAVQTRRAWLRDFEHDRVSLSADLYEVLMAYQDLRQTG